MDPKTLESIFNKNIAPALTLSEADSNICNGMSERVAKKHRNFSQLSHEEQLGKIKSSEM